MDLGPWLRSFGLEEYETAFRENKVEAAVLPKLTAEDLRDLGVAAVGDRRKLIEAIVLLRREAGTKAPPPETPSAQLKSSQDSAERRQVTVMFSDLVGSTALSARIDPKDHHEIISAYQKCVAQTVQRFDGSSRRFFRQTCYCKCRGRIKGWVKPLPVLEE